MNLSSTVWLNRWTCQHVSQADHVSARTFQGVALRGWFWSTVVLLAGYVLFLTGSALSAAQRTGLWPLLALIGVGTAFWVCLARRDRKLPLFELGGFCMVATVVYAAIPLVWYILGGAEFTELSHRRLYLLDPTPEQFAAIGWMYVAYAASLGCAYLLVRDRRATPIQPPLVASQSHVISLVIFFGLFQLLFAAFSVLFGVATNPAYDESLYASQEAYTQLPLAARQIFEMAHACAVVVNCALVVILTARWRERFWRLVLFGWIGLTIVEYLISPGSRFLLVGMIVSTLLAYDRFVRRIRPAGVIAGLGLLFAAFVVAGLLRGGIGGATMGSTGSELLDLADNSKVLFTISNEFQISYGSSIELKYLMDHGLLPQPPWQVFASELLLLIPQQLLPFEKVDPVLWYVNVTHDPDFFTYGVVAQSVLGLGWFELVLRGLMIGALFALIYNWWARAPQNLWRNVFTIWLVVVCYYTVRNTSFYLMTLIVMRFLPIVLLVQFLAWLLRALSGTVVQRPALDAPAGPSSPI